jgi:hypothetical protein
VAKGEARIGAAPARILEINLGLVDAGDGSDVGRFEQGKAEATGPAADIEHAVTIGNTAELDQ